MIKIGDKLKYFKQNKALDKAGFILGAFYDVSVNARGLTVVKANEEITLIVSYGELTDNALYFTLAKKGELVLSKGVSDRSFLGNLKNNELQWDLEED